VGYFERVRQTEESADQILQVFGPLCYLTTSDAFDAVLAEAFDETIEHSEADRNSNRAAIEQVQGIMAARKRMYGMRKPGIIAILSVSSIQRLLDHGIAASIELSDQLRHRCRQVAATEVEKIAAMMEAEPMGLQFGLLPSAEPTSAFKILRARDRATLAINPFRPDGLPNIQTGVAMITGADEAIATHQRVAEAMWRDSMKGAAGAMQIRRMLQPARERVMA
jgi:hypothetical protein